jgi:ABC-type multidrug transport system fused ATPase/permease subunit
VIEAFRYFLGPYRRRFALLGTVTVIAAFLEGLTIAAFFPVFLALTSPAAPEALPRVLRAMVNAAHSLPWSDPTIAAAALLGAVLVTRTLVLFARDRLIATTGGRILYDLRQQLLTTYAGLPYHVLTAEKQGVLMYRAVVAPGNVALVLQRLPQCAAEVLKIIAIGGILLGTFPVVTGVLGALLAMYVVGTRRLSSTLAYDTGADRSAAYAEQMELAQQVFAGIRHLHVYRADSFWLAQFERANRRYRELYERYLTWLTVPRNVMELGAILLLMVVIVGARVTRADDFALWLPALGLFALATVQLLPSLTSLGRMWMEISEARPDLEGLYEATRRPRPAIIGGDRPFTGLNSGLAFEQVEFGYERRAPILRGLSFSLSRGTVTAITGPSGAGKTTMVNLLLGLLEPSA